MKLFNLIIASFALGAVNVAFDGGSGLAAQETPNPLIYGFMASSDEWRDLADQAYEQYGYYTFRPDGSEPFKAVSPIDRDQVWATHGGVYADGIYYGYDVSGNWANYTLRFMAIDAATWRTVASNSFSYKSGGTKLNVPTDMAYDAINNVLYASTRNAFSDQGGALCSVNPTTGELTRLGDCRNMCALTADPQGNLYGIEVESGALYLVAKNGSTTKIGETGFYPSRDSELIQSMTYDFASGKIFWSMYGFANSTDRNYNRNSVFAMVMVDPATGEGNITWTYPRDQRFSSISIMNAHPYAPADIADLSFLPAANESTDGVITFTVPATTTAMVNITEPVTVTIYLDQELLATENLKAGTSYRKELKGLAPGQHNVSVEASHKGYAGNRVYASTFFGIDVPEAVTNVSLKAEEGSYTKAVLTWDAPVNGVNGSALDLSQIRYRVQRYPDDVTVARSLSATTFSDEIKAEFGPVNYVVTPYHVSDPANLGRGRRSNTVMLGVDIVPPYEQHFDTERAFNTFTTIDANGDAPEAEWESPCWKFDEAYYCAFYYGKSDHPADDWLITPPIAMDPNRLYRLSFQHYAYYGYGHHFEVKVGDAPTVEGMTTLIADIQKVNTFYDRPGFYEEFIFAPAEGDRFIGFHHMTTNNEHLSIDDIVLTDIGDSRVPAAITDLAGTPVDEYSISLKFTAPSLAANRSKMTEKMTVEIFRDMDEAPIASFKNTSPGSRITWTDEGAVAGINSYFVRATNSFGNGLWAETSVDLTPEYPESASDAVTRYINDRQVEITWNPSITANEPGEAGLVRYLVHRIVTSGTGEVDYPIIGRDLTECRFVDDDPRFGMESSSQKYVQYYVSSVNGAGLGIAAPTTGVFVGDAYRLPFAENWNEGTEKTGPWLRSNVGAAWYVHAWPYEPSAPLPDGVGLLDCEVNGDETSGAAYTYSPRIDLTSQSDPKLTFKMWNDPCYNDNVRLYVGIQRESSLEVEFINTAFTPKSANKEWVEYTVDLAPYASERRVSICLAGYTFAEQRIHLTDLRIEGKTTKDAVRGAYIIGASDLRENETSSYSAFVSNYGSEAVKNVKVEVKAGDEVIHTATIASIAADAKGFTRFDFAPKKKHVGTAVLSVNVVAGTGYNADSTPATKEVRVKSANYGAVNDLGARVTPTSIRLNWSLPYLAADVEEEIDDFEAYTTFAIDSIGGWTTYDGDRLLPFRLQQGNGGMLYWKNCDKPQAFMVFAPQTVANNAPFEAYSGSQMLISFGSPYGANNDWLISPELTGESQLVSFYASAMRGSNKEGFHFLVSRSDRNPESFVRLNGKNPIKCATSWDLYHFALPEGTRYFAINYVGEKQDGLMIDDVLFISNHHAVKPDGYNIYRDGVKLNSSLLAEPGYTDEGIDPTKTYTYVVRPVFKGQEGDKSNECVVLVTSIDEIGAQGNVEIYAENGEIVVENCPDMTVGVYTPDGRMVANEASAEAHRIAVAPGVYLVRVGTTTAKVVVR